MQRGSISPRESDPPPAKPDPAPCKKSPEARQLDFWVDAQGDVQQDHGQLSGGSMRYANIDQSAGVVHLTFTPLPGGKVRQLSEMSKDGGKTFTTQYDFTYSPAKK